MFVGVCACWIASAAVPMALGQLSAPGAALIFTLITLPGLLAYWRWITSTLYTVVAGLLLWGAAVWCLTLRMGDFWRADDGLVAVWFIFFVVAEWVIVPPCVLLDWLHHRQGQPSSSTDN